VLSLALTLLVTPVAYSLWESLRALTKRLPRVPNLPAQAQASIRKHLMAG
jgi:hypothetical protein